MTSTLLREPIVEPYRMFLSEQQYGHGYDVGTRRASAEVKRIRKSIAESIADGSGEIRAIREMILKLTTF